LQSNDGRPSGDIAQPLSSLPARAVAPAAPPALAAGRPVPASSPNRPHAPTPQARACPFYQTKPVHLAAGAAVKRRTGRYQRVSAIGLQPVSAKGYQRRPLGWASVGVRVWWSDHLLPRAGSGPVRRVAGEEEGACGGSVSVHFPRVIGAVVVGPVDMWVGPQSYPHIHQAGG
jgi:hypothetical protein